MGVPGNANALLLRSAAAAGGYQVSRSLRFNSSDSAYLSRTPASAGNRKTWTWAGWVKRNRSGRDILFGNFNAALTEGLVVEFGTSSTDNILSVQNWVGNSLIWHQYTTAVFRDFSSWYHVVIAHDTTQAASVDRVKLYVNGVLQGSANGTAPSLNYDSKLNTTEEHAIGRAGAGAFGYTSAYLADVFFIDGQALTPSSFTETSATTGQLIPKAYTGSFGTNGFWLKFSDNSAATATTLGKDYSGNNNNWSPSNLSVTAGAGNDSLVDTPTSYGTDTGAGGEVRGNYATLNPLVTNSTTTLANGNLDATGSEQVTGFSSIVPSSGKWYLEITLGTVGSNSFIGLAGTTPIFGSYCVYGINGFGFANTGWGSPSSTVSGTGAAGDVIGLAFDVDAKTLQFYKNGSSIGTISAFTYPQNWSIGFRCNAAVSTPWVFNFGQRPFAYTAPSGFKALCDTNLPAPVVAKPNTAMDVKLYTGNASSQTISGIGFSPDLVWIKKRSGTSGHLLQNSVTGTGTGKALYTNTTGAEGSADAYGYLSAITSDGFTTQGGTDPSDPYDLVGANNQTYVSWLWDAGSSTVTNTQGSITGGAQVRANPSAGFSIITFTMGSGSYTVGHGLNTAPSLLITKARSNTSSWWTYHASLGTGSYLALNSTAAAASDYSWGSAPTSTVFTANNNFFTNGYTYVVYAFSPVAGYSSFGSYTGNGSASGDGPFVYTGFRPKWLMFKKSSASGDNWVIVNSAISPYNLVDQILYPNASDAQTPSGTLDFLSNGFKLRNDDLYSNQSGATYIYAAFAESPFQFSRAR